MAGVRDISWDGEGEAVTGAAESDAAYVIAGVGDLDGDGRDDLLGVE